MVAEVLTKQSRFPEKVVDLDVTLINHCESRKEGEEGGGCEAAPTVSPLIHRRWRGGANLTTSHR